MTATLTAPEPTTATTAFHVTLAVTDLGRSVRFYQRLLGCPPRLHRGKYARFELTKPALVLVLVHSTRPPGGALSHVGLRMGTAEELDEVQRRMEEAGISQAQQGVECCYANQTKFWATDPDGVLWELYVLHHDIGHSGFDDPPLPKAQEAAGATWSHRLTDGPLPSIPRGDGSLDEVKLEGTFNVPMEAATRDAILAEVRRVLRPGGRVAIQGLVADRPFPGVPNLPGMAAVVRHVPVEGESADDLRRAGFEAVFFEKLGDVNCIGGPGIDLRHVLLTARTPLAEPGTRSVLYRGPFARVSDGGIDFPRGVAVEVPAAAAERLRRGPAADQFSFLQSEPGGGCCGD